MNRLRIFIFSLAAMCCTLSFALDLKVKSFVQANEALASIYPRLTKKTEKECALVRVFVACENVIFDNSYIVGDVEDHNNEYWVYMAPGAKKLTIKAPGYSVLNITFSELNNDIKKLEQKATYDLYLEVPERQRSNLLQGVEFNVKPKKAHLTINNKEYDLTDGFKEIDLGTGEHTYSVSARYYQPVSGKFTLDGNNKAKRIDIELEHAQTTLNMNTNPAGADLYIDGKKVGTTPFTGQIDAGPHKYTLRKTNYATLDSSLVAIEDKPLTINQKMIAIIPFTIKSNAYGANVYMDGWKIGETPVLTEHQNGEVQVRLTCYGYHSRTTTLNINGKKDTYTVNLKRRFFYPDEIYLSVDYGFGNLTTVGATMGFFLSGFNVEASLGYGLDKKDEIYWLPNYASKAPLASADPVKYNAFNTSVKLGYGMLLGNRIRFTPQVGINYTVYMDWSSSEESDMTSVLKGCVGARFDLALAKGFCLAVSPEYNFKLSSGKPYESMAKVSETINKASKGFRMVCSLVFHFSLTNK